MHDHSTTSGRRRGKIGASIVALFVGFACSCCGGMDDDIPDSSGFNDVRAWPIGDCNGDGQVEYALCSGLGPPRNRDHVVLFDGQSGAVLKDVPFPGRLKGPPTLVFRSGSPDVTAYLSVWFAEGGGHSSMLRLSCSGLGVIPLESVVNSAEHDEFVLASDDENGETRRIALARIDAKKNPGMTVRIVDLKRAGDAPIRVHRLDRAFYVGTFGHFVGSDALDLCLSNPWAESVATNAGVVCILDGETGALTQLVAGNLPEEEVGRPLENLGDVDHDGWDEVLVGRRIGPDLPNEHGELDLFSVADGRTRWTIAGARGTSSLNGCCHVVDDADGDGIRDLVRTSAEPVQITLISGATGTVLRSTSVQDHTGKGRECAIESACACPDRDGDGKRDILIAYFVANAQRDPVETGVAVVSSADGRILFQAQSAR